MVHSSDITAAERTAARHRLRAVAEDVRQVVGRGGKVFYANLPEDIDIVVEHSQATDRQRAISEQMAAPIHWTPDAHEERIPAATGDAGYLFIPAAVFPKVHFDFAQAANVPTIVQVPAGISDVEAYAQGWMDRNTAGEPQ
jgi:hypothetical protein